MSGRSVFIGEIKSPISQKEIDKLDALVGLVKLDQGLREMKVVPGFRPILNLEKIPAKKKARKKCR
jgi:fructose-bisphosphate aldolase class 1